MLRLVTSIVLLLAGCAHSQTSEPAASGLQTRELASLRQLLADEHMAGVIAVLRDEAREVSCSDAARCVQRVLPASTFKIPNALIGLETGVIADAEFVIAWDGVVRDFPNWNRDQTLRSAIQLSAVPYFQELARRVGPEREALWTRRLDYGNSNTGPADRVDQFWLEGPLTISPVEQTEFLRRFATGKLAVSTRSRDIVRDIIVLAEKDGAVLRGKTGWAHPHQPGQHGWFVGYVERGAQRTYIAVLLEPKLGQDGDAFLGLRRAIAERALTQLGSW